MAHRLSIALLSLFLAAFIAAASPTEKQTPLSPSNPHTTYAWSWSDCGQPDDIVQINSLAISPDPPKPGQELTVTASGYVSTTITDGAFADVSVKLGLIKLLTRRFDICQEAKNANATIQCPVQPGDHAVVQTVSLPKEIPPAKFNVEVRAYSEDENNLLCANINIDFFPSLGSGLFRQ